MVKFLRGSSSHPTKYRIFLLMDFVDRLFIFRITFPVSVRMNLVFR